jgi:hypothetical protein
MQPFEVKVIHRAVKHDPAIRNTYLENLTKLRSERLASPPGPGNLRKLKKQAEKDALAATYQSLGSSAESGRAYDRFYARVKGITTRD